MLDVESLGNGVMQGKQITLEEAVWLYQQSLEKLCRKADEIRAHFCSNRFDICTIINGKSGRCSENCRFCAQSIHNHTNAEEYPLLPTEEIVIKAKKNDEQGVLRYSIVTSGKRLSDKEINQMCGAVQQIREKTGIAVCISFGLLNEEQYRKLRAAGVTRVHNNLETSRKNFSNICTTHTFEDKINAILLVADAGLGTINGVGLTAFYMKEHDIPLKGIIFNHFQPQDAMQQDNLKMCEYLTGVKVVACVQEGATNLDISVDLLKSLYEEGEE
ncbi:MAG: radical SAM protein [Acetivibrio ethanolgignens]